MSSASITSLLIELEQHAITEECLLMEASALASLKRAFRKAANVVARAGKSTGSALTTIATLRTSQTRKFMRALKQIGGEFKDHESVAHAAALVIGKPKGGESPAAYIRRSNKVLKRVFRNERIRSSVLMLIIGAVFGIAGGALGFGWGAAWGGKFVLGAKGKLLLVKAKTLLDYGLNNKEVALANIKQIPALAKSLKGLDSKTVASLANALKDVQDANDGWR
jgi:hypothetical protein